MFNRLLSNHLTVVNLVALLLKFVIATAITVPLTYMLADVIRRIPGLNKIF